MTKVNPALERAIIERALIDPEFFARLAADPLGFLKGLAHGMVKRGRRQTGRWGRLLGPLPTGLHWSLKPHH